MFGNMTSINISGKLIKIVTIPLKVVTLKLQVNLTCLNNTLCLHWHVLT